MNKVVIVIILFLVILIGGGSAYVLLNPADAWICHEGEWIRKGSPKTSQPTTPCHGADKKVKLPVIPPESSVVSFYMWLIKEDQTALQKYKESQYLSTSFKELAAKQLTSEKNPFLCDTEKLTAISIKKADLQGMNATVTFEQKFEKTTKVATATVTSAGDAWKIETIACKE